MAKLCTSPLKKEFFAFSLFPLSCRMQHRYNSGEYALPMGMRMTQLGAGGKMIQEPGLMKHLTGQNHLASTWLLTSGLNGEKQVSIFYLRVSLAQKFGLHTNTIAKQESWEIAYSPSFLIYPTVPSSPNTELQVELNLFNLSCLLRPHQAHSYWLSWGPHHLTGLQQHSFNCSCPHSLALSIQFNCVKSLLKTSQWIHTVCKSSQLLGMAH